MSEHDFSVITAVERSGEHTFVVRFPTGWEQGRGVFGGAVVGAMARAAIASEPEAERTVRQCAAELVGPVPSGVSTLTVTTLRRGNGLTALDVMLRPEGTNDVFARGSFTLAKARSYERRFTTLTPPEMPPFDSVPANQFGPPLAPVFTQHVRFRPTGPWPFSGVAVPATDGWVEMECSSWGPPEWLGLCDTYWPSVLAMETAPRPAVTVGYTCHLFVSAPNDVPPRGPLFVRVRGHAAHDGFVSETRELWTPDGRLVALNPQLFAVV